MSAIKATSFKETSLFDKSKYDEVARILDVPKEAFEKNVIGVTSVIEAHNLLSFHYHQDLVDQLSTSRFGFSESEIRSIKRVRGIVIKMTTSKVKCMSFPRTSICVRNEVTDDGLFRFIDGRECTGVMIAEHNTFKRWIPGTLVRVFMDEGVVFYSTHKAISFANSRFGSSATFEEMWYANQDTFTSDDEIFDDKPQEGIVRMFIIKDIDLIVDSTEMIAENEVYYIKSFSLEDETIDEDSIAREFIEEKNKTANHPIKFADVLSIEDVNTTLNGGSSVRFDFRSNESLGDISHELRNMPRENAFEMLRPGESVALENEYGVFRIMPPAALTRNLMMDGKTHIAKLFADCIAEFTTPEKSKRIFVPVGLSRDQLESVRDSLQNGERVDLSNFETLSVSDLEIVLTNLVFSCPRHRIQECFDAYDEFGNNVLKAVDFLWENQKPLRDLIFAGKIDEFPGLKSWGVCLKRYLCANFCACFITKSLKGKKTLDDIIDGGKRSYWHHDVVRKFNENTSSGKKMKDTTYLHRNAVLCLVVNAPGDVLFSLFSMRDKVLKARTAFAARDSRLISDGR